MSVTLDHATGPATILQVHLTSFNIISTNEFPCQTSRAYNLKTYAASLLLCDSKRTAKYKIARSERDRKRRYNAFSQIAMAKDFH